MYSRDEIAPGIHQLRFFDAKRGIGFNQYLIAADEPALVSTGAVTGFDALWAALSEVLEDPARLRYLVVPHFESDEAGALAAFVSRCAAVRPVAAAVAARQITGFGLSSDPLVVQDGDHLDLGSHSVRFTLVPWEMHLWEGLVAFEERHGVLFSSDLFGQRLDPTAAPPPDLLAAATPMTVGSVPSRELRCEVYGKLAALAIRQIAPGHGFVFTPPDGMEELFARIEATPMTS
jgi:flavorubredoxin